MGKRYYSLLTGVFFFSLVVCCASRVVLKLRFMDVSTGFYNPGSALVVLVFNIFLFGTAIFLLVASRLRRVDSDYPVYRKNRLAGFFAVLSGLAIAAHMLLDQPYPVMEQGYTQQWIKIRGTIGLVLGLIAGISLIWIGVGSMIGRLSHVAAVPALFGCLWQMYMLITRFNSFTVVTTISDNLLAVMFMVFASLFLVGQARTVFGLARKDGRNYTIPTGFCVALFGFSLVLPNYLFMTLTGAAMPAPMLGLWESVYILTLSFYALSFVVSLIRSIRQV